MFDELRRGFEITLNVNGIGDPVPRVNVTLLDPGVAEVSVLKEAFTVTAVVRLQGFLMVPNDEVNVRLFEDIEVTEYQGGAYPRQAAFSKSSRTGKTSKNGKNQGSVSGFWVE